MLTFFCENERFARVTRATSFATDSVSGGLDDIAERH
jgi:hypothetical protein